MDVEFTDKAGRVVAMHRCSFLPESCRYLVIALVLMTGCSLLSGKDPSSVRPIDSARGGDPSVTPFQLDVLSEANDGDRLVIAGRLVPKTDWAAKDVVVRLTALEDSGEQRVSFHQFSDLMPKGDDLRARVAVPFSLSLPSEGVSNFQLEVLWGKDAQPYIDPPKASLKAPEEPKEYLALRDLEVHRVPDGSCASPEECLVKFSIKGEFFNAGSASIKEVVLVAGFSPADKLDLPNQILENERRIEVRNLRLAGGATKPFRLTLEKYVPATDQVAYQPVVRIVSFSSE
jgi:hypothetical protein